MIFGNIHMLSICYPTICLRGVSVFRLFLKTRTHSPAAHAAPHLVQMALVAPGSRLHPSWKINNSSNVALKIVTKKRQTLQKLTNHFNFDIIETSRLKFLASNSLIQKSEMSILAHTTHRSAQGSCKVPRAAEFTAWWPKSSAEVPCSTWQAAGAPNLRTESEKLLEQLAWNSYDSLWFFALDSKIYTNIECLSLDLL